MKKIKVLIDFTGRPIPQKIVFYRNVIDKLTSNPTFPSPDITLTDAKSAVDALENAYVAARDGAHTAISNMHDKEVAADRLFIQLAAYVDRIAMGDETKILSSGFDETKQPTAREKPTLVANVGPLSGSVKLVAKAVYNAGAYIWQSAKDNLPTTESEWITVGHSTQANYELTGLTVMSKYYFRVAAVTPEGTTDFSAAIEKIVI